MTPEQYVEILPTIQIPVNWENWLRKPKDGIWADDPKIAKRLKRCLIRILHKKRGSPSYYQDADIISMPQKNRYRYAWAYYGALFHEVGHWTGHPDRMNRGLAHPVDNREAYAREELIAEMVSRRLCIEFNMEDGERQHLEYLKIYWDHLCFNREDIFVASEKAHKALRFINSALLMCPKEYTGLV